MKYPRCYVWCFYTYVCNKQNEAPYPTITSNVSSQTEIWSAAITIKNYAARWPTNFQWGVWSMIEPTTGIIKAPKNDTQIAIVDIKLVSFKSISLLSFTLRRLQMNFFTAHYVTNKCYRHQTKSFRCRIGLNEITPPKFWSFSVHFSTRHSPLAPFHQKNVFRIEVASRLLVLLWLKIYRTIIWHFLNIYLILFSSFFIGKGCPSFRKFPIKLR